MIVYTISELATILDSENIDNINIFCQYFIHSDKKRHAEIKKCLKYNIKNKYITKIYLLNEKIYSRDELGVTSDKIVQVNIGKRLKFQDVFDYISSNNVTGYNVIINSDIFFDETIKNLYKSDIHINKKMFALLRYEYDQNNYQESKIFGPRGDSQDTWIVHSNFNIPKSQSKIFNFEFGKPGCDNKLTYLMSVLGFEIINDPKFIKTIHVHNTNVRNYNSSDKIKFPYEIIVPKYYLNDVQQLYKIDVNVLFGQKFNHKHTNIILHDYIQNKILSNSNFIIPRVAGIENNYAIYGLMISLQSASQDMITYLQNNITQMKNNAGILVSSQDSLMKYSKLYLEAFELCDLYSSWAPFDNIFNNYNISHTILNNIHSGKDTIYSEVFDIYHYIFSNPWTHALKGKRILMVSQFEDSIKGKIDIRKEIYGIDLFPDCDVLIIKPPQTQGQEPSEDFEIELKKFTDRLDLIKDTYDIALVSCGGYGNLVCAHIYKSGKSAIYVGGVLQMYWGILGTRWFENRPDIIRLFLNKHWSRPKESEKPSNHASIERSCYW